MTAPPRTLEPSMAVDELMQRTPAQVAAYFIPDIIHVTAGCTSRKFRREQPPIQKQLDEILHKLLERTTHQSQLLAEAREALERIKARTDDKELGGLGDRETAEVNEIARAVLAKLKAASGEG